MNKKKYIIAVLLIIMFVIIPTGQAEDSTDRDKMVTLTVRGASISDVLLMLTEQSGINLVPDETVQGVVTVDLREVNIQEAMKTLTIAYGFHFDQIADNIYLVSKEGYQAPAEIRVESGLLTLQVENGDIRRVLNTIAEVGGVNIIMDSQVSGSVSANLRNIPLERGLVSFLQANGFLLSKIDNIYRVFTSGNNTANNLAISVVDGMVNIDVQQADLGEVLRTIARLGNLNMVLFSGVRDVIDLKLDNIPLEQAIDIILSGTRFTYHYSDGVYMVGEKTPNSPAAPLLTSSHLIPLEYLKVETVPQLLPTNFPASNVKVIKEKNALLVTGTQSEINYLKDYITKIDTKIPQIVVDALIIEITGSEDERPGIKLGMKYEDDEGSLLFDSAEGQLNFKSVMNLPNDFYLNMNYLIKKDLVTVKARPNITTLNGQEAKIDIGQVQYYKVMKEDEDGTKKAEYESVNAGITLEVTPWVSSNGEITLQLKPTYSTMSSTGIDRPPEVSSREVSTNVRVKDGQTIVIGGLIQDKDSNFSSKVPVLGDLPVIGSLFKTKDDSTSQTELVIYITPHVLKENAGDARSKMQEMLNKIEGANVEEDGQEREGKKDME